MEPDLPEAYPALGSLPLSGLPVEGSLLELHSEPVVLLLLPRHRGVELVDVSFALFVVVGDGVPVPPAAPAAGGEASRGCWRGAGIWSPFLAGAGDMGQVL